MRFSAAVCFFSHKRDSYTRQSAATFESTISDTRYTVRNSYTRQSAATIERLFSDTRYTFRNCYTRQSAAIIESRTTDTRTACYNYFFQIFRNVTVVITIRTGSEYIPEMCFSTTFCFFAYKWNSYTCQPAATFKSVTTDTCYAVGYYNTRQSAAT